MPPTARAASALTLAASQRGSSIRGSVRVTTSGSSLLARAVASRGAVQAGKGASPVQVGRRSLPSVAGGRVSFTVRLTAVARRALRRDGRLATVLRLTVTPPVGAAYNARRTVVLRR
jgi:hypothetical protein